MTAKWEETLLKDNPYPFGSDQSRGYEAGKINQAKATWEAAFQAGKAECALTHFKPDWKEISEATHKYDTWKAYQDGMQKVVDWLKEYDITIGYLREGRVDTAWLQFKQENGLK